MYLKTFFSHNKNFFGIFLAFVRQTDMSISHTCPADNCQWNVQDPIKLQIKDNIYRNQFDRKLDLNVW